MITTIAVPINQQNLQIKDVKPDILSEIFNHYGNKPFLKFLTQGFEQFVFTNAYDNDEEALYKTVENVPKDEVSKHANDINSHVPYKLKYIDDG